jgi:hypothetical protein
MRCSFDFWPLGRGEKDTQLEVNSLPLTVNRYVIRTDRSESCGSAPSCEVIKVARALGHDCARAFMCRSHHETANAPTPNRAKTTLIANGMSADCTRAAPRLRSRGVDDGANVPIRSKSTALAMGSGAATRRGVQRDKCHRHASTKAWRPRGLCARRARRRNVTMAPAHAGANSGRSSVRARVS